MFYLYLLIFSFAEFYLFNNISKLIFTHSIILGDFIFSIVCVILAFLILIGTLHIKHLNNNSLKKVGFGIIILGWIIFVITCFIYNINTIFVGFYTALIFSLAGYLVYYYQTVPEGEPDTDDQLEEENMTIEILNSDSFSNSQDYYDEFNNLDNLEENFIDPNIENLIIIIESILEIEDLGDSIIIEVKEIDKKIKDIKRANSEYKKENLHHIQIILQKLKDSIILENNELKVINQFAKSFELINKNLENIYYNTRGAKAYRIEKEISEMASQLNKPN